MCTTLEGRGQRGGALGGPLRDPSGKRELLKGWDPDADPRSQLDGEEDKEGDREGGREGEGQRGGEGEGRGGEGGRGTLTWPPLLDFLLFVLAVSQLCLGG